MRMSWTLVWVALLAGTPAMASEIILFDGPGCAAPYRVLIDSEDDLADIDFADRAASVRVVAGTWSIHRDDGFGSDDGPAMTLSPDGCVDLGQGGAAQFPPDLMNSVQLVTPAPGPDAAVILYDDPALVGSYRVLTTSAPDLAALEFDDRAASFEVIAGLWRIYRDQAFQSAGGPSVDAGVGACDDIEALGFPRDQASSAMRLTGSATPAAPQ